jgi:ubiquinone/menaquinone biosynthesis C-methylase UbiE
MPAHKVYFGGIVDFSQRLLQAYNDAALTLMISIGHQLGLFTRMRGMAPSSSAEIAAAAGLHERYVREWLGAMVTGGVVLVNDGRYHLPEEHAACLTGPDSMAGPSQYIAEMGSVEHLIVKCFREGGGVGYDKYPRFHAIMAEDSAQFVAGALEQHILPLVPGLVDRLREGIRVVDVGCGRGMTMAKLAELFPRSTFVGVDFSEDAIAFARANARTANVTYRADDATTPLEESAYDFATTFDAIHDQGQPLQVLQNIRRALKPGGVYLMQEIRGSSHHHSDIGHPLGTLLYTISCMHCMTVSLAQGGEGLGAMWGEEKARDYLTRAGFASVEKHELTHDIQNDWYVAR